MKIEITLTGKKFLQILGVSLLFWASGWLLVYEFQGRGTRKKPAIREDFQLKGMSRVEALSVAKIQPTEENVIDFRSAERSLKTLLERTPDDYEARIALGEVQFSLRDFEGAISNFKKVPKTEPTYIDVAAKIGSALTLLGRAQEAIVLLEKIVSERPDNFKAQAFWAVALAQAGHFQQARVVLSTAIQLAPSPDARVRLERFLTTLPESVGGAENAEMTPEAFEQWLRKHPVVGSKVESVEIDGKRISIVVRDFPMGNMPTAMRSSFMGKVWSQLDEGISEVVFLDSVSEEVLFRDVR
jgi:tetratricopeptide (TPR) repeat protein